MIYHQFLTIRDLLEAGCEAADYAGNAEFSLLWHEAKTTPIDWFQISNFKFQISNMKDQNLKLKNSVK